MSITTLPAVNASLNASSAFLLLLGYLFIRQRAITAHTMCMLAASFTSLLFLVSYIYYHLHHGATPFPGRGPVRVIYFAILISHTGLALTVVPLALLTLVRALRGQFVRHVRIARFTLPIWLYVSVTGVVVYWMLYQINWLTL